MLVLEVVGPIKVSCCCCYDELPQHAEGSMLLIAEALVRLGTEVGLLRKRRFVMLVPVCGMEPPLRGLICGCLSSSALYRELKTR